jgi:hypothetical protein
MQPCSHPSLNPANPLRILPGAALRQPAKAITLRQPHTCKKLAHPAQYPQCPGTISPIPFTMPPYATAHRPNPRFSSPAHKICRSLSRNICILKRVVNIFVKSSYWLPKHTHGLFALAFPLPSFPQPPLSDTRPTHFLRTKPTTGTKFFPDT